jgi:hypothetical protein
VVDVTPKGKEAQESRKIVAATGHAVTAEEYYPKGKQAQRRMRRIGTPTKIKRRLPPAW